MEVGTVLGHRAIGNDQRRQQGYERGTSRRRSWRRSNARAIVEESVAAATTMDEQKKERQAETAKAWAGQFGKAKAGVALGATGVNSNSWDSGEASGNRCDRRTIGD